jgi:hypothetical protein
MTMFIIHLRAVFHIASSNSSLVITIKAKPTENILYGHHVVSDYAKNKNSSRILYTISE